MRNLFYIIALLFCQSSFCQEYVFDNFYEFQGDCNIAVVMINSQNNTYYFTCRKGSETIWGYLNDYKENIIHNYEVINFENGIQFNYLNSTKIKPSKWLYLEENMQYDVTNEIIDSTKTKSIIIKNQVNKRGKKKYRGKVELVYYKNNDLFPSKLIPLFGHHFFDNRDLSFIDNKLPQKITYNYTNGTELTCNLTKKLKINTTLKITKEQINYKQ
jgi:hypothetical protein